MWNSLTWVVIGVLVVALGWIVMTRRGRSSKKQLNEQRGSNVVEFRSRKPVRKPRVGNTSKFKVSSPSGSSTTTEATGRQVQSGFGLSDPIQHRGKQKCSFCRKEDKLIFYADDNGSLYGACKECRIKAERQDMLPL
ncbi:hypothetical protein [Paenibacillus sp. Aloe-11]|uniref:hypothetical protein n=1 Tax=Paenibacillus sp. Aloe-11 TaxID=1050222 RepID=UPI00024EFD9B|nr:hypothetical protein [Paenibacillus sp. Aloe-11]EHS56649.1 hypothetical protein WG8_2919 [Paenibacillus sp. Aloe-11]